MDLMEAFAIFLGASLGAIAFGGFPGSLFQLGAAAMTLPLVFALGSAAGFSYIFARKYKDPRGLTWYGRYGETPAGKLLWGFMYASCIVLASLGTATHFPGIGDHYVPVDHPLYTFVNEGRCVDHPTDAKDLCTMQLCNATRQGDKVFADWFCKEHPETCVAIVKVTPFDWAMSNCGGTCGCHGDRDPFNPVWYTADDVTFECEKTDSCTYRNTRHSITFSYLKYPSLIEIHVATGVFIMLLVPLQLRKSIRSWNNKAFHRWNGRCIVLLVIPNQITAAMMAIVGIFDEEVGVHLYAKVFRAGLGMMIILTVTFVSCAIYYVKVKRNIPRHGEFMMRAATTWFAIPFFRMLMPFFQAFFGARWTFGVCGWVVWTVPLLCTEVYIRRSDRFVTPSHSPETATSNDLGDSVKAMDLDSGGQVDASVDA